MRYLQYSLLIALGLSGTSRATVLSGDGLNLGSISTNQLDPIPTSAFGGYGALALGEDNDVSQGGAAIGWSNNAANYSLAIGEDNNGGVESFVLGYGNNVGSSSYWSFIVGDSNSADYNQSAGIIGSSNSMGLQWGSSILGIGNQILAPLNKSGTSNVILGGNNIIKNTDSSDPTDLQSTVLIGAGNESHASMAYAIGVGNIAQAQTVTLGTYAATASNASLIVGNGTSSSRSNVLLALKDGSVVIPSGNLVLNGESALTPTSAQSVIGSHLTSNNYLKRAWGTNASITNGGLLAVGSEAASSGIGGIALGNITAAASNSVAIGTGAAAANSAVSIGGYDTNAEGGNFADGENSTAIGGLMNYALGFGSYAMGCGSNASQAYSIAFGYSACAFTSYGTALGVNNIGNFPGAAGTSAWSENEVLFELGNGNPTLTSLERSNAITTFKNGQTTLTNKAWKANTGHPLDDPTPTTDAGGEALVVEGHTRLKGKVIIEQPQGDISMGIYGN